MRKYLRFANPLLALAGLGLCVHAGVLTIQDQGREAFPWTAYFLAKGLFGGLGLVVLAATADGVMGSRRERLRSLATVPSGMTLYLRWGNPLAAAVVLGLCVYSCQAFLRMEDGVSLPVYFLAKGLFCSLALLLAGVIAGRVLSERVGQDPFSRDVAGCLRSVPPVVAAIVLALCIYTFIHWVDDMADLGEWTPYWAYYFLGSGVFCAGTLVLLGWLARHACGAGAELTSVRAYLRWVNPLLALATLGLCGFGSGLWATPPKEWWGAGPFAYFMARAVLNGVGLFVLGVLTRRFLEAPLVQIGHAEEEATK